MAIPHPLQRQIESITEIWTHHTAQYAQARVTLLKEWTKVQSLSQQVAGMEQRVARIRRRLMRTSSKQGKHQEKDDRGLVKLERDIAQDRINVAAIERKCRELASLLEKTWDIW